MKKWIALVLTLTVILTMSACKGNDPETPTQTPTVAPTVAPSEPTTPDVMDPTVPDVTDPDENEDLVYDMANYQWLSDVFREKTVEDWNAMGRYTLRLEGLYTPVVLNMYGTSILSVSAFDQTVELGAAGMAYDYFDGYSPVDYIRSTEDAVVIRISGGVSPDDDFILITKDKVFRNPKERGGHIALWVEDDGTLGYRQTWMFPEHLDQSWFNALQHITGRDQVLYQTGRAEIVGDELDLITEDTVVVSDLFDLDAIFAECKAAGKFTAYETLDELFEDNKTAVVYDMENYQWFSDIFEENPEVNWMSMGRYTIHLGGLHTPVVVNMNGLDVLSVTAFDQTVDLGTDGMANDYHDGYSGVQSIRSTYDAVVIHVSFGEMGDGSILITKNQIFKYPKEFDSSIFLWVKDDGTLGYRQTWIDPKIWIEGWDMLYHPTSRDMVMYQEGTAEIVYGELALTSEKTVLLSDYFDLDTMFAEAKAEGWFEEYETLDELFEDNKTEVVYDMANYQWLSDIFEEKTVEDWNAMGRYTLRLEGLYTPVVLNMYGTSILSVSAFDQTVDLGTDGMANDYHDGYSGVWSIRSTYDAVVIHVSFGEMGDGSILITKNQIFKYPKEFDSSIFLWVKDDGTLGYRQTWIDPKIEIEGWHMLYYPTSRDMMMYQEGTAEIVDGELVLTAEKTVLLSDYFDLDALFAEAKAYGMFTEYETVDELFEANKARE